MTPMAAAASASSLSEWSGIGRDAGDTTLDGGTLNGGNTTPPLPCIGGNGLDLASASSAGKAVRRSERERLDGGGVTGENG